MDLTKIDAEEDSKPSSSDTSKKPKNIEEMFIVRLPVPVPYVRCAAPNLLFVRQDDIGLFRELRKLRKTLLIGNAGIGKSWFQWIYLLFCTRPDIYKAISEDDDFPPDRNGNKEPPQIILRYTPTMLHVFFLPFGVVHVFRVKLVDEFLLFHMFDEPRVTLLYDPEDDLGNLKIPALRELNFCVSLSPFVGRFETWKTKIYGGEVLKRFMPAPSLKELIATMRAVRGLPDGDPVGDDLAKRHALDELVKSRFAQLGPFLREILESEEAYAETLKNRMEMFKKLDFSVLGSLVAMSIPDHPENHFIHTYVVDRGGERPYANVKLELSCDLVVEEAKKALAKRYVNRPL